MTTTMITTSSTPYRVERFVESCHVCGAGAMLSCPRCGRPFCAGHAEVTGACADCELELASRFRKVVTPSVLAYCAAALVPVMIVSAAGPGLALLTGALLTCGGLGLAGAVRRLVRRQAIKPWLPVANPCQLQIAPDGGPAPKRKIAPRRETDMYRRAYNAGFNRVQGCA